MLTGATHSGSHRKWKRVIALTDTENPHDCSPNVGNYLLSPTLDWILPPLEQLMTFFIPSLTLFLEKIFCLISLVMLSLVL